MFVSLGLLDYEDHDAQCAEKNAVLTSKKPVEIDLEMKRKMVHFARDFSASEPIF